MNKTKLRKSGMKGVYKKEEYEAFVKLLESGNMGKDWTVIADALEVHRDTITEWKKLPRARKAIIEGIQKNLKGMEKAGSKDWRMYREKLKMLGIPDKQNIDHTSKGDKFEPVNINNFESLTDEQLQRIIAGEEYR